MVVFKNKNIFKKAIKIKNHGIKIWGNKDFPTKKKFIIKNYLKDHRIFMTSIIAALCLGGKWTIEDKDSHVSSFPSFLSILKKIGYRF